MIHPAWRKTVFAAAVLVGAQSASIEATADVTAIYGVGDTPLFSIAAPDDWVLTTGRETNPNEGEASALFPRVLGMHPENDRSLWIGMFSPEGVSDIPGAEAYIRNLDGFLVEDPKIAFERETLIEGRPAKFFRGGGTRDGRDVEFSLSLIQLPNERVVIGVFVGEDGARQAYAPVIDGIVASFRSVSGGGAK